MGDPFSKENLARAIARVPEQGSVELRRIRDRVAPMGIDVLVAAIDAELALRPQETDAPQAERNARLQARCAGLDLVEATRAAFTDLPASPEEQKFLPLIAAEPGISSAELIERYGKGDIGLAIGHLVKDRYGAFLSFAEGLERMSDVLIERETIEGRIHYRLRPEAETAFRDLGLI